MGSLEDADNNLKYFELCRKNDVDPIHMNLILNQTNKNGVNEMSVKWTASGQSKNLSSQEKINNMKKVI